jgi:mono/diheme cytochrome c family protein
MIPLLIQPPSWSADTDGLNPGLAATFYQAAAQTPRTLDALVLPNLRLNVPEGSSPTPFLEPGPFDAEWTGFLDVPIRSSHQFEVDLVGHLELQINGKPVLTADAVEPGSFRSKSVRLAKGTNQIRATLRSLPSGQARLRLNWIPRKAFAGPVPNQAFWHADSTEIDAFSKVRLGRSLFLERRCAHCHTVIGPGAGSLELTAEGPSFQGIGSRLNQTWMTRWILNPIGLRSSAKMPRLLHGITSETDVAAIAAFLATCREEPKRTDNAPNTTAHLEAGKQLFNTLRCTVCHGIPGTTDGKDVLVNLDFVDQKFAPGTLASFLLAPEQHHPWSRMPNFHLSTVEANQLATFLRGSTTPVPSDNETHGDVIRGRALVQSTGCLNCHKLDLENRFTTHRLSELSLVTTESGCLAIEPARDAPFFSFSPEEIDALRTVLATDRNSLLRHVPSEFAHRQIQKLACARCHGQLEGAPELTNLGGKLKGEWCELFIAGRVPYKPRHWLPQRMPAFPAYAAELSRGLAMEHGYDMESVTEPDLNRESAEIGRQLAGAAGGFSCVSCHPIGSIGASMIFETTGINFAYIAARLRRDYFERWLLNPLAIDPTSKMPTYFDEEGRSPLIDIHDGDARRQIHAIWEYLRLGDQMPPPPGLNATP